MGSIRFDDRIAIVTGAGEGIGREYALDLAKRGAKVIVNDIGEHPETGKKADKVVKEIKDAGGDAVATYDTVATVDGGKNIVHTALEHYGHVDILVCNAGILRDRTFKKGCCNRHKISIAILNKLNLLCLQAWYPPCICTTH